MKIGIKIYPEPEKAEYCRKAAEFADFIEVMAMPSVDVSPFRLLGMPFTVHAPHLTFNCNLADSSLFAHNVKCLEDSIRAADILDARVIVVHPGTILSDDCDVKNSLKVLEQVYDPRISLENMIPPQDDSPWLQSMSLTVPKDKPDVFSLAEDLAPLMELTKTGLCLDFAHACATAACLGKNYKDVIDDLVKLKPNHFHLSGGFCENPWDGHLSIFEGDYPNDYFKSLMPDDAWVTLETPSNLETRRKECDYMRR